MTLGTTEVRAETLTLPFYENFEPTPPAPSSGGWDWSKEWHAFNTMGDRGYLGPCMTGTIPPDEPRCPWDDLALKDVSSTYRWGPLKFESWPDKDNGGHVFSGQRSGRQPTWDPNWGAIYHVFEPPTSRTLCLKVQVWDEAGILCDCDPWGSPSRPNFNVRGAIELSNGIRSEYYFIGVNSHQSWDHYSLATKSEGWIVTPVPRTRGWHKLEIVVHPYSGAAGDVEFWIDGVLIHQGYRRPGDALPPTGVHVNHLRLGGDPAIVEESSLTNTMEEFWYDEVALTNTNNPAADFNGDGAVDMIDFAAFQKCWTGPGNPFYAVPTSAGWDNENKVWLEPILFDAAKCQAMDLDGDQDVDAADFDLFLQCASGPMIPADKMCGH